MRSAFGPPSSGRWHEQFLHAETTDGACAWARRSCRRWTDREGCASAQLPLRRLVSSRPTRRSGASAVKRLKGLLDERIVFLDGAMGTMIQQHKLDERAFRGDRFRSHGKDLKGNNDILVLTKPEVITEIHRSYLEAGADIVETNTFNSSAISQADYGTEALVPEINYRAARIARETADQFAHSAGRPAFVAGALGPTSRMASLSPDVNDPGYRSVTFDDLVTTYTEAARALLLGGVDLLLIETVFDTLNAKAAIYAVQGLFEELGMEVPLIISGTISDASGRVLSGQTTEAFWNSIRHAKPLAVGLNCALGATQLRQYVSELSRIADTYVCAYPNAGLPNAFGEYDETAEETARRSCATMRSSGAAQHRRRLLWDYTGSHPADERGAGRKFPRRAIPVIAPKCRLSGLEPLNIDDQTLFVNVGERTNVTGSAKFRKLIEAGDYTAPRSASPASRW